MSDTPIERLKYEAAFLVARIDELDWCGTMDAFAREWEGHVDPPLCRLRDVLATIEPIPSAGEGERAALLQEIEFGLSLSSDEMLTIRRELLERIRAALTLPSEPLRDD